MKKFLIFAGLAGMLASCSSDETVSDPSTKQDVLSFSGYVGNMTRSVGVLSQISDVEKMDVWCDINENGTAKKYFQDTFNRITTSSGASSGYSSTQPYYWVNDISASKTMSFIAFHNATQSDRRTITGFAPNAAAADQQDVLVAYHESSQKETPQINLNFRHILSQIDVRVKNTNPKLRCTVTGVRIGYVKTASTQFKYSGGVTDTQDAENVAQNNWTLVDFAAPGANQTYAENYKYEQAVTWTTPLSGGSYVTAPSHLGNFTPWILLPQDMKLFEKDANGKKVYAHSFASLVTDTNGNPLPDVSGSYIGLKETITFVNEGNETVLVNDAWVYWPIDELTNWNPGNKYTYVIDINSGYYPVPPGPGPGPGPNPPIVPVFEKIEFSPTCTVDNWDDGGTYDLNQ